MNAQLDFKREDDPVNNSRRYRIQALLQKISASEKDSSGLLKRAVPGYWCQIRKYILFKG